MESIIGNARNEHLPILSMEESSIIQCLKSAINLKKSTIDILVGERPMKEFVLAGVSIVVVVILALSCQTSVVGYRVIKNSQENLINESVSKIKTEYLTFKGSSTNSKQSTGVFGGLYSVIALIHFIFSFICSFLFLWASTDHGPSYFMPIFLWLIMLISQFFSIAIFSTIISYFIAAIWPFIDLLVLLTISAPALLILLIKVLEFIDRIIRPWNATG